MPIQIKNEIQLEIAHVLFIDIVGYSKLSISDQHAAIEELNQVVRASQEFQRAEDASRLTRIPTGDGMVLAFYTGPEAPAQCALEISRALKGHPRLQLRMGIHSGPVGGVLDVNERANLAGAGINIAQRVMDCGDAGHILVSKHVAEDLEHYPRWQPYLHDLGECEVKHAVRISVVNFYTNGAGNSAVPEKFRSAQPVVAAPQPKRASPVFAVGLGIAALAALAILAALILPGMLRLRDTAKNEGAEALPGAIYTPLAVSIAMLAWVISGEAVRFLAVLVIATPCPLLIAIPVAIIGSISLSARRSIIIKNPAVLEQITSCRSAIFDKTGTLTYGEPRLTEQLIAPGFAQKEVLTLAASLELYSKHPLARAILAASKTEALQLQQASQVSERPGQGLQGTVAGHEVQITSRGKLIAGKIAGAEHLPTIVGGLECIIVIDGRFAAAFRFRDAPRAESRSFIKHLGPKHQFQHIMVLSGDRESEVRYLAKQVGISEVHAEQSPEQKLAIVRQETAREKTLYVGDGINDAPAMMAATVGMAIGQNSDVTAEAADVVAMENSLKKVDEFMHISRRMRSIAVQSAVGGMLLSLGGMMLAAAGFLAPVAGAIAQEIIDVVAVLNALRAAFLPKVISDMAEPESDPQRLSL